MKIKSVLLTALVLIFGSICFGQSKKITFKQYAVKAENLKNVKVNLASHRNANTYRTNLRNAAKEKVNFAGHFILTTWGCGTNCTQSAIIDARSGSVFFPDEFDGVVQGFCDVPTNAKPTDATDMADEYAPFVYQANSRLLVLNGFRGGDFNDKKAGCGAYYLEWTGKRFKQIKFTPGKRTTAKVLRIAVARFYLPLKKRENRFDNRRKNLFGCR